MKEYVEKDKVKTFLARIQESQLEALPIVTRTNIKKSILQEVWDKALGYECFGLEELAEVIDRVLVEMEDKDGIN